MFGRRSRVYKQVARKPESELPIVIPARGGTEKSMLVTDPVTGEIFRRGGGKSVLQMKAEGNYQAPPAYNKEVAKVDTMKDKGNRFVRQAKVGLRKAGKKLSAFDENYANALYREGIAGKYQMGHAMPVREAINTVKVRRSAAEEAAGEPDTPAYMKALGIATNTGLVTANVASRYALPAGVAVGGVTLAGQALAQLTQDYQTSGTLQPS